MAPQSPTRQDEVSPLPLGRSVPRTGVESQLLAASSASAPPQTRVMVRESPVERASSPREQLVLPQHAKPIPSPSQSHGICRRPRSPRSLAAALQRYEAAADPHRLENSFMSTLPRGVGIASPPRLTQTVSVPELLEDMVRREVARSSSPTRAALVQDAALLAQANEETKRKVADVGAAKDHRVAEAVALQDEIAAWTALESAKVNFEKRVSREVEEHQRLAHEIDSLRRLQRQREEEQARLDAERLLQQERLIRDASDRARREVQAEAALLAHQHAEADDQLRALQRADLARPSTAFAPVPSLRPFGATSQHPHSAEALRGVGPDEDTIQKRLQLLQIQRQRMALEAFVARGDGGGRAEVGRPHVLSPAAPVHAYVSPGAPTVVPSHFTPVQRSIERQRQPFSM